MSSPPWPSHDEVMTLPVDELGLQLLALMAKSPLPDVFDRDRIIKRRVSSFLASKPRTRRVRWRLASPSLELQQAARRYEAALRRAWAWLEGRRFIGEFRAGDYVVTRSGRDIAARDDAKRYLQAHGFLEANLHSRLSAQVQQKMRVAEYEGAVFAATRDLEIRVRELTGNSSSRIGVALIKDAFREGGKLRDPAMDGGEADAIMALFWGTLGVFKNHVSHRHSQYDVITASKVVVLADLLHELLDQIEQQSSARATPDDTLSGTST